MRLQRRPDGSVLLSQIDKWHLGALRKIPALADPGSSEKARKRLFPDPYANAGDASAEQQEDWDQFVRPDLEALFSGSLERVAADLKTARPEQPATSPSAKKKPSARTPEKHSTPKGVPLIRPPQSPVIRPPQPPVKPALRPPLKESPRPPSWSLTIPADHVEDWFRAMNQARLVLSSTHEAHRTDNDYIARMFMSGRMQTVLQYELLTSLCGWWIEALLSGR